MNMQPIDCETCQSGEGGFFCSLKGPELQFINDAKTHKSYKKGDVVFERDEDPKGLYCVLSGIVKIETENDEGRSHILRLVRGGQSMGYRALFGNKTYQARAVVHENSEICFINKEAIHKLVTTNTDLSLKFLQLLSEDVKRAETRLCSATSKDTEARVAETLLFLDAHYSPTKPWTRKDIADWAGTTPETVMRQLPNLEVQGLIASEGRRIKILDSKGLQRLAKADEV